jgi:multiple sugar transport system substrate-binding protein
MLSLRVGQSRQAASAHGGAIRTIATGIAVGLAVSMSGCSAAGSATSGMSGKTVKMFTWVGNASDHDQWAAYINGGKLVDPSLSVDFSGPAIGSYYTKLPTQLQGTAAPCLITLQNGQLAPYVNALEPLDAYMKEKGVNVGDYDPSMIKQLSSGGHVYALPYDAEPLLVYYNKKLFAAAGVKAPALDWTTADFLAAAKKTTRNGVYGFAIGQGIGPVGNFLVANNENYVSNDGKADFSNAALEKRFQWLIDLARVDKVAKPLQASGGTFPDIDEFGASKAAMFINGTWDLVHEQQMIGAHNLGVAVIPSDNGQPHGNIAGTGYAMTKSCSDKKAAFAAIAAMTSSKSEQSVAKSRSQVPSRADSLGAWQSSVGPEAAAVVKILTANGQVSVAATNLNKINTLFSQYEVDGFSGKSTAAEVLKNVSAGLGQ